MQKKARMIDSYCRVDDRFLLQSLDPWRKGFIDPESIAIHKSMGPALKSNLPKHQPSLFNH